MSGSSLEYYKLFPKLSFLRVTCVVTVITNVVAGIKRILVITDHYDGVKLREQSRPGYLHTNMGGVLPSYDNTCPISPIIQVIQHSNLFSDLPSFDFLYELL